MAKTSRKQSASFSVTDPSKVLNFCSSKLKPLLGELGHTEIKKDLNRYIYNLILKNPRNSMTPDDRGNSRPIIPLLLIKSDTYWINISLTFLTNQSKQKIKPDNFEFSGISITVSKGAFSADKEPVLRAEWDALKDDNNHAQPHWHVYKSFQTADSHTFKESDFTSSLTLSNEVKDFGEIIEELNLGEAQKEFFGNPEEVNLESIQEKSTDNNWDSSTRFHFAMASQWHTKKNHRVVLDKEALLYDWLVGCVQYIIEQLKYVSGSR